MDWVPPPHPLPFPHHHHVIPTPITSFLHPLRHSRVGGNPTTPISSQHSPPPLPPSPASRALPSAPPEPTTQIPAYAGMTSGYAIYVRAVASDVMDWVPPPHPLPFPHHHHVIPAPSSRHSCTIITSFPRRREYYNAHIFTTLPTPTPITSFLHPSRHSRTIITSFPHPLRHSRTIITSFPRRREYYNAHIFTTLPTSPHHSRASRALPSIPQEPTTQIPAYAGMTGGRDLRPSKGNPPR